MSDILRALDPVVEALEELGIPYQIGGSVASSAYGAARSSLDVDIVARLHSEHIGQLVDRLGSDYYIDAEMIADALARRSSFNLIHLETMLKVDVFIPKDTPYAREAFGRSRSDTLHVASHRSFIMATPEDVVLNKLEWYRRGGEISDRQWGDIVGVLKVQGDQLDMTYLRRWAEQLDLLDLFERALEQRTER